MNRIYSIIVFTVLFALLFQNTGYTENIKIPLYKIAPVGVEDLKCADANFSLKIPIPERWDVKSAVLDFGYVNSSALLQDNSRLVIKLNENPLAQIALNPVSPEGDAKILLPADLLEPGYNDLTFQVSQHHTLECENPCAPELWTTLKLDKATLEIEYEKKEVPLKLSSISDFLFDPRIFPYGEVNIVTEKQTAEFAQFASTVTSGIALRYDFRKVEFTNSSKIKPGVDNIVIGGKDFVQTVIGKDIKAIDGAHLQIRHLPSRQTLSTDELSEDSTALTANSYSTQDRKNALIVVSGNDMDEIKLASKSIAIISFPFPNTGSMEVEKIALPHVYPYTGKQIIGTGSEYSFKTLDFGNYTFSGANNEKQLVFRLPTDLLIEPNRIAELSLHMVYGAGMRSDSVLNIILNDKYVGAIHLDNPNGAAFSGYKITIPAYLFKRGKNVINFEAILTPSVSGHCEIIQTENLFLSIFDDSWFEFPSMMHWVDLPRMELFFEDGFPFTRWPDGRDTALYMTSNDHETVGSALNLIGLMSQKIGYPLLNLGLNFEKPKDWNGDIIVVGEIGSVPENLKEKAPLKYSATVSTPYPVLKDLRSKETNVKWQKKIMDFLLGDENSKGKHFSLNPVDTAYSNQTGGLGEDQGMLMEFESPYTTGRSVLLMTANSKGDLLKMGKSVLDSSVQSNSKGSLTLVDFSGKENKVWSQKVGDTYYSGKLGKTNRIKSLINASKWKFFSLLAICLVILTASIFIILKKFRRRRFE